MEAVSKAAVTRQSNSHKAILLSGLSAGVLDLTAALVNSGFRGVKPIRVLQFIASGLLGRDSFNGGVATAALGVGLHFLIAFVAAAVYYGASRKLDFLVRHAIVAGLLYGVAVYLVMNLIVAPLSAVNRMPFSLTSLITGLMIHMLFVGLPISLAVRRYSKLRGPV